MGILQDLNADGVTIVLITHDPELARIAGRRVDIVDGKIVRDEGVADRRDARAALGALVEV